MRSLRPTPTQRSSVLKDVCLSPTHGIRLVECVRRVISTPAEGVRGATRNVNLGLPHRHRHELAVPEDMSELHLCRPCAGELTSLPVKIVVLAYKADI